MSERSDRLRELIREVEAGGGGYHVIDFGDGLVLPGEYDLRKVIHHYGIPEDLRGATVLDIGTATGFLAFECARRGASVTAIDVWDGVIFDRIREGLGLDVRYVQKSLYDLDAAFGRFDLVICGSLLLHLRDLFGAVERIRSVCAGRAILTSSYVEVPGAEERALCEFVGVRDRSAVGEYWVYWSVTPAALARMLQAAGFAKAHEAGRFDLVSEPGKHGWVVPHVVMHAEGEGPGFLAGAAPPAPQSIT